MKKRKSHTVIRISDSSGLNCQWARLSPQGAIEQHGEGISISHIPCEHSQITILLPANDFFMHVIPIKKMSSRQLKQALPHLLADYLICKIDSVYYSYIKINPSTLFIFCITKERLQAYVNLLSNSNIYFYQMYIDSLALPYEEGVGCVSIIEKMVTLRFSTFDCINIDADNFYLVFSNLIYDKDATSQLQSEPDKIKKYYLYGNDDTTLIKNIKESIINYYKNRAITPQIITKPAMWFHPETINAIPRQLNLANFNNNVSTKLMHLRPYYLASAISISVFTLVILTVVQLHTIFYYKHQIKINEKVIHNISHKNITENSLASESEQFIMKKLTYVKNNYHFFFLLSKLADIAERQPQLTFKDVRFDNNTLKVKLIVNDNDKNRLLKNIIAQSHRIRDVSIRFKKEDDTTILVMTILPL